jgi:ankyrin repeat protein
MQKTLLDSYIELLPEKDSYLLIRKLLDDHPELLSPQLLFHAVINCQIDVVILLLHRGVNVNAIDQNGCTALHYCARDKAKNLTQFLLQKGAKQVADKQGETPFQIALKNSEMEILSIFLENYDADYNLESIKQIITNQKFPEKIRFGAYLYLITRGELTDLQQLANFVDLKYRDSKGNNAILIAIRSGRIGVLPWLLSAGLSLDVSNDAKEGPVLMAIAANRREVLDLLLKSTYSKGYGLSLNVTDEDGLEPVLKAVACGSFEVLEDLLKEKKDCGYGLTLNVQAPNNTGPVLVAVKLGQSEMLTKLVKPVGEGGYGLDINIVDAKGLNPVLTAAQFGQGKLLRELVTRYGLNLSVCDQMGNNVVLHSIWHLDTNIFADLVRPQSKGGYGLSVHSKGQHGAGVVLNAVYAGNIKILHELVTPLSNGGYGLAFEVDKYGRNAVLVAVACKQKKVLDVLIKPIAEKGYGLSLASKNSAGQNAVLVAAAFHAESSFLADLVKPASEGGEYGLSLDSKDDKGRDVVRIALLYNRVRVLDDLLKPRSEGGFERKLQVIPMDEFTENNKEATVVCLMASFNRWLTNDLDTALKNVKESYSKLTFAQQELKSALVVRFKELLEFNLGTEQSENAAKIAEVFSDLAPNESHLVLGDIYAQHRDFVTAYENYLSLYLNSVDQQDHEIAGFQLANLIINGDVILEARGNLDEKANVDQGYDLTEDHLESRKKQGTELASVQDRAIKAYEYLHDDKSARATALRERLDSILSGNLTPNSEGRFWTPEALKKFQSYYSAKNKLLLCSESYTKSLYQILDHYIELTKSVRQDSGKYSPQFFPINGLPVTLDQDLPQSKTANQK